MIRAFILVGLFAVSAPVNAAELLSVPGLAGLVADKAKEAQAIGTLDLKGNKGAGAYLPVWTYREGETRYARIGAGWEGHDLGGRPIVPLVLNLPALSGKLWSSAWAQAHIERVKLPPVWFGPYLRAPLPNDNFRWEKWRDFAGLAAAVGFGG